MRKANLVAILILGAMFAILILSSKDDSATFDEVAHITAGYTYLKERDGRLNPEHPPLIKMISAVPLLFLNLNFNKNQSFWTKENVNDRQWEAGSYFLYRAGNNADKILFWSRLPIIILTVLFGWILFWWTKKNYGASTGLLALLFFALSPTVLAHGRYVTTDIGASFAFFLSIIFFIKFLKENNLKSLISFGLVLGIALLMKFSLILLLPFFIGTGIFYNRKSILNVIYFFPKFFIACVVALIVIFGIYTYQIWNYPQNQNISDAKYTLGNFKTAKFAPKFDFWLISNKLTRPLGQYLHGFLMVTQRTAGGNNAYFMGEVSSKGWVSYFPTLYATKEQIGFFILLIIAFAINFKNIIKIKTANATFAIFLIFIAYYWAWSLWSPLNIGIRHILPIFPFLYILVSKSIIDWVKGRQIQNPQGLVGHAKNLYRKYLKPTPKIILVFGMIFWMVFEIASNFPFFISYYNILGGGLKNGYKIATDSNYDWGQDLIRLKKWTENNVSKNKKIYIDYFGGGSPKYYFQDQFEPWWSSKGPPPKGSFLAISLNTLLGARAKYVGDLSIKPEDAYAWLLNKEPIAKAGNSIFIFNF